MDDQNKVIDAVEIMKRYGAAKKDKEPWLDIWDKYQSKFDGRLLYTKEQWQSDISKPLLYMGVTKMVAKELKECWGRKFWELEAVLPDQEAAVAKKDRLLEVQIMGHRGRMKKWQRFATFKYLYGPGIVKMYWGDGSPTFDVIDPRYVFPEPGAETVEEAEYICHEALVSKDYVKQMFKDGVFTEEFEQDTMDTMLAGAGDEPKGMENTNRDKAGKANLIEYWEDDRVIVVLNKKWKVRDEANPYEHKKKPFLFNVCLDSWNAIWGSGIAWNTYNIYDKLDRHINMRLDLARLLINPPIWKGAGAGVFTEATLKVAPGKVYPVTRINETAKFNFDGALDANNVAIELLQKSAMETTALDDMAMQSATQSETANGVATASQSASDRIELYTMQNSDFAVKFVEMWCELNKQFLMELNGEGAYDPMPIKMESREGISTEDITKEDLDIKADIIIRTNVSSTNRLAVQQNEIQLYGMLKGDMDVDQKAAKRGLLQSFDRDVDEYMLNDEEKIKYATEAAALQMALQQSTMPPTAPMGAPGMPAPTGDMTQASMGTDMNAINNTGGPSGQMQG